MATLDDLSLATRELFVRSVKHQVFMQTPILEELERRNKITYSGGKYIERLVDTGEVDELGQAYTANEPLTDEKKDTLEKPRFNFKLYQHPMKYDVDEYLQNHEAASDVQLLDLAEHLVRKSQRGIRLALRNMLYNVNPKTQTGSETGVGDSSKFFQSLLSALDHDVTYGGITRTLSSSTNSWWQGADPSGQPNQGVTVSTQNTAANITISNLRKWIVPIEQYMEKMSDLYCIMCPTLWNKLRAELEAKGQLKDGLNQDKIRYGIQSFSIDGMEVVKDPYLEKGWGSSGTTENWVFILNLNDWELRIHNARNFKQTEFKWQGENANGFDYYLARILLAGNFLCWKPNGSMWLQNVS
jgi:hypothetical protein